MQFFKKYIVNILNMMSFLMNIKKEIIFIVKHLRNRFMMNVIIYCSKVEKINLKFY